MIVGLTVEDKTWTNSSGKTINIFDMTSTELILVARESKKKSLIVPYEMLREIKYRNIKDLV